MTKVLLIISALVMLGASMLGYQNGRTFKEVRESKSIVHGQITTALKERLNAVAAIGQKNVEVGKVQTDVEAQTEKLKSNKLKIVQSESETKRVDDELKSKADKMAVLRDQLQKLPAGFNPQTIAEDLNKIKQEIAELQTQAESKKQEVAGEEKKVTDSKKVLEDIVTKIEARQKSFERNSLRARVVAVNNDWGFLVIDAGESAGITPDTKLIVVRGTQTVAKVSIIAVQGSRTVANILTDTLAPDVQPAPGDSVILENLYQ